MPRNYINGIKSLEPMYLCSALSHVRPHHITSIICSLCFTDHHFGIRQTARNDWRPDHRFQHFFGQSQWSSTVLDMEDHMSAFLSIRLSYPLSPPLGSVDTLS